MLPAGFKPFNIQAVQLAGSTVLVVAYARESDTEAGEEVPGAGDGLINTFTPAGALLQRLISRGGSLYAFWGSRIAEYLNQRARADKSPVVINLASEEYFKAVDLKALRPRVVQCVFEERKGAGYKVISFMAKRARGLMVRWALQQRASTPEQLKGFDLEGYRFEAALSGPDKLVFRRDAQA